MNLISIASLVVLLAMATAGDSSTKYDVSEARSLFEKFENEYHRNYKDDADREEHFRAFKDNLVKINELNEKDPSAQYGINKFADYTEEERKSMFGYKANKD